MNNLDLPPSLPIEPLTREAFTPFGEVIETEGAHAFPINQGTTTRFHDLCRVDVSDEGGKAILSIFRGTPRPHPIEIKMLERHPLGSQAFFPLNPEPWLAVVALSTPDGAAPDLNSLRCFRANPQQGVNYAKGVWHHPLLCLAPRQDFLIIDRDGSGNNLEEIEIALRLISPSED
ncbi:MAG: ureidoglycolate lyase [Rhodobacteraceae bacterium]|nr:ureidoglycolate lyase [Paracoccaceae bacterium]